MPLRENSSRLRARAKSEREQSMPMPFQLSFSTIRMPAGRPSARYKLIVAPEGAGRSSNDMQQRLSPITFPMRLR